MRTLVFDPIITGHHLEYLHHYYLWAIQHKDQEFIFCLDPNFVTLKDKFAWPLQENISISLLSTKEYEMIHGNSVSHRINTAKLLRKKIILFSVNKLLMTDFVHLIPFLLIYFPRDILFYGIIYRVYLVDLKSRKILKFINRWVFFTMISISKKFVKIFVLNDSRGAEMLNKIHHTSKFIYLPDPVPDVDISKVECIREKLLIPINNRLYLHFGGLCRRKGTIEILKAIEESSIEEVNNVSFVFAGCIYDDIRKEFYELINKNSLKTQILVFDEFCSYEFIYSLCKSCDVILAPYLFSDCSSGVIGYGSVFSKPIVGPSTGLMGNLIRNFDMGVCISPVNACSIRKAFSLEIQCDSSYYIDTHSVSDFLEIIFE